MVASAGNDGNEHPAGWPAAWDEVFPVSATIATIPIKQLWEKSNIDKTRATFASDGANKFVMDSETGDFDYAN